MGLGLGAGMGVSVLHGSSRMLRTGACPRHLAPQRLHAPGARPREWTPRPIAYAYAKQYHHWYTKHLPGDEKRVRMKLPVSHREHRSGADGTLRFVRGCPEVQASPCRIGH
jgi:hypothetical protein